MPLAPPPSVEQDINSRQFRDWFYSIYALIGKPGTTLGTMAYQDANSVAITGGAIGGVGISGSTINSTPIGQTTSAAGKFTALEATSSLKTDTLTGYLYGNGSGGDVTASTTIPWSAVATQPYIEVVDTSSTITLTTTPILLQPTTVVSNSGITYNSSTGVFTFINAGSYNQVIAVNALASAASQYVYIYAQNWNGSTWITNANSGKQQALINGDITQVTIPNAVKRTAGQQVRYYIYSNSNKVTLQTTTLPGGVGAVVPTIRIQYS